MATPRELIQTARSIYNDADSVLYRKDDDELLSYVNDAIREISALRPEIWNTIGDIECTEGEVEQAVTFADAQVLVDVLCIHGGSVIHFADMPVMDRFRPGWRSDDAGAAQNWMRKQGDPLRFFIWPKAPASQTIDVMYVRVPLVLTIDDPINEVPVGYHPAIVDYVVYRAESADDEHSNSGRATAHFNSFVAKVKG